MTAGHKRCLAFNKKRLIPADSYKLRGLLIRVDSKLEEAPLTVPELGVFCIWKYSQE
jgi:hypothetical protein